MIRSIRWRLLLWYAVVLLAVVGSFAGILYYRVRQARLQEIDLQLEAWTQYLDAHLRAFPPHELDGSLPKGPPRDPKDFKEPKEFFKEFKDFKDFKGKDDRRPGPPTQERRMGDLDLPQMRDISPNSAPYFAVWRANGTLLKGSGLPEGSCMPTLENAPNPSRPDLIRRGNWREARAMGPWRSTIVVGRSMTRDLDELAAFAWQLTAIAGAVLVVGLAGGWLIAARIVRPLAAISKTASAISATSLGERIATADVDSELAGLAGVLNAMFDRLQQEFERQTRFTADASHELRTPLAILRTHAELALARERSPQEYQEALHTCLRAAQRMTALVDNLLTLARADAGRLDLRLEPVDLAATVGECVAMLQPLAAARSLRLEAVLPPTPIQGDAGRLAQVATNLLGNAIQFCGPGGQVFVDLHTAEGDAELSVSDTGPGIPMEDQQHLFERFYRVDKARARSSGGTGLGLAICRSIVEAHGGSIDFTSTEGKGTTFRVRLPLH